MIAPRPLPVVAAVLVRDGRFLVTQRRDGSWEFPGGKQEPDETLEAALARELREELALEVQVGQALAVIEHAYPDRLVRLHFFRCQAQGQEPQPLGVAAWRWAGPEELAGLKFLAADRRFIETVLTGRS